jgi:iron-sulfur cluster repair protein YtfE (RIC family)
MAGAPAPGATRDGQRRAVVAEVERHHAAERRALPYIGSLLPKIAGRFRGRDGRLDALCDAGEDLVEMLEAYIEDDERRLLPAAAAGGCEVVREELDRKNGELEAMLAHVRALARDYVAPEWGDGAYRALMEELEALEQDVRARVRMEERELVCEGPDVGAGDVPRRARVRPAARVWAEVAARGAVDEEE